MFEYKTKVKIDLKKLREVCEELHQDYLKIGHRDSHEGRSKFSTWNNIAKFLERNDDGTDFRIIEVVGAAKGNSARVYYTPSITSLAKPFRKCIVPINSENKFMFFDLKAAEFFMNCVFAGESAAVEAYQSGFDIYEHYKHIFPQGTERKVIKKILIAYLYGITPYRISLDLGISEAAADRLLRNVSTQLPALEMLKFKIISNARRKNAYFAPKGFDQTNLIRVAEPKEKLNELLALSAYTQSALGFFMQDFINQMTSKVNGTLLTGF